MKIKDMKVGAHHVVTKSSKDGTFKVGDHIHFYDNGDIGCVEAGGWIAAKDVKIAAKGCETEVDKDWIAKIEAELSMAKELAYHEKK